MADNSSTVERTKGARGQTIVRSFGRDDSSMDIPNSHGKELKGGVNNLAHSLSGASAVQDK